MMELYLNATTDRAIRAFAITITIATSIARSGALSFGQENQGNTGAMLKPVLNQPTFLVIVSSHQKQLVEWRVLHRVGRNARTPSRRVRASVTDTVLLS